MIQRIQTVYLLLAIVLLAVTNFVPLLSFQTPAGEIVDLSTFSGNGISFLTIGTSVASVLLCIISIFMYKSRKKQILVSYLALIPILLLLGYFIGYSYGLVHSQANNQFVAVKGIILPIVSIVFILLAIRKIKADEKLVRSLDRIR